MCLCELIMSVKVRLWTVCLLLLVFPKWGKAMEYRWRCVSADSISWEVNGAHFDHIEMSGQKVSAVLRYGVDNDGNWIIDRNVILPTFRTVPNDTHGSLQQHFKGDWAHVCIVNGQPLNDEQVQSVSLSGILTVKSVYHGNGIALTRTLFPSTTHPAFCEKYELTNITNHPLHVMIPTSKLEYHTDSLKGVEGMYRLCASLSSALGNNTCSLQSGEKVSFQVIYAGYKRGDDDWKLQADEELEKRRSFLKQIRGNLILETPIPVLNTMFSFAKIRGAESIFDTKGGYMQSPGGEAYYAAVWANDQAEYINPFFPYLGYKIGNQSAMDSFRLFMRYMNEDYHPLPSSVIAEGKDCFSAAGDRGDAAMIAYGAARYALASGCRDEAEELWPLIEWCLEYCRRQLNEDGVIASDSDELENRFSAGKANLCTSSLYYDALLSAFYLGKSLGKPLKMINSYRENAAILRKKLDLYFAATVEGYDTYRYYDGNTQLRSWICMPLSMGIYDRAKGTVAALFSDKLWMENGLLTQSGTSTYWDRSTLYALRGSYACGAREIATEHLIKYSATRLLGEHVPYAIEAWPEGNQRHLSTESALYCRIAVEGLLGIRPIGLKTFLLTPQLPDGWSKMALRRICSMGDIFDIEVYRVKDDKLKVLLRKDGKVIRQYNLKNGKTARVLLK